MVQHWLDDTTGAYSISSSYFEIIYPSIHKSSLPQNKTYLSITALSIPLPFSLHFPPPPDTTYLILSDLQNPPLHLIERAQNAPLKAIQLKDAIAKPAVNLPRGALLVPALADQVVEALGRVPPLQRPDRLVGAAEGARVPAHVELVDAVGAAEDVADDARDGRVVGPAPHEVDAPRLRGQLLLLLLLLLLVFLFAIVRGRTVHEPVRPQPHRQRLRLDDGAGVGLGAPVPGVLLQVGPVARAREAPRPRADVGHDLREGEVEADLGAVLATGGILDAEGWGLEDVLVEGFPGVFFSLLVWGGREFGEPVAHLLAR